MQENVRRALEPIRGYEGVFDNAVLRTRPGFAANVADVLTLFVASAMDGTYLDVATDTVVSHRLVRTFVSGGNGPFDLPAMLAATFARKEFPLSTAGPSTETSSECYARLCATAGRRTLSMEDLADRVVRIACSGAENYLLDREAGANAAIDAYVAGGGSVEVLAAVVVARLPS